VRSRRAGRSQPWPARRERTSGQLVHVLDFSDLSSVGTGWRLVADGATSHPFPIGDGLFDDVREDALRFFYLMRSGCPIDDALVPGYGRPAGHVGRAPNGGDTAVAAWAGPDAARLYPGWHQPGTFDVSGGWYDAGDYGKYVTSGAIAVWQVLSALEVLARQPAGAEPSRLRDPDRLRVSLAARLAASDDGAGRSWPGRDGVPSRPRYGVVADAGMGA